MGCQNLGGLGPVQIAGICAVFAVGGAVVAPKVDVARRHLVVVVFAAAQKTKMRVKAAVDRQIRRHVRAKVALADH